MVTSVIFLLQCHHHNMYIILFKITCEWRGVILISETILHCSEQFVLKTILKIVLVIISHIHIPTSFLSYLWNKSLTNDANNILVSKTLHFRKLHFFFSNGLLFIMSREDNNSGNPNSLPKVR